MMIHVDLISPDSAFLLALVLNAPSEKAVWQGISPLQAVWPPQLLAELTLPCFGETTWPAWASYSCPVDPGPSSLFLPPPSSRAHCPPVVFLLRAKVQQETAPHSCCLQGGLRLLTGGLVATLRGRSG